MSNTPVLLPFRFLNFNKKNKFLKIVQQKGFEVISENQTILSAITKGGMSQGIIDNNSYSTSSHTENVVAYDIGIKKILDDEDKKYIDLLAEYLNFNGIKRPGFFGTIIGGYILGWIFLSFIRYIFPHLQAGIIAFSVIFIFFISGPTLYYYLRKNSIEEERVKNTNYQTKLKPYLQGISF
ncbi:hypothetical protein HOO68_04900 [Candidatus Gracilibacteria bacterium]|nr:hypothetical protein [Candidatus Gracilibacteria bacterium]